MRDVNFSAHLAKAHGQAPSDADRAAQSGNPEQARKEGLHNLAGLAHSTRKRKAGVEQAFRRDEKGALRPQEHYDYGKMLRYWFVCKECKRKSQLPTGFISVEDEKGERLKFMLEVMCKHCGSHNVEMEQWERYGVLMRLTLGVNLTDAQEAAPVVAGAAVGGVEMDAAKAIHYYEKALASKDADDWEKWTRYANLLKVTNRYDDAIAAFRKAGELKRSTVAPPLGLGKIFFHRWKIYGMKGARQEAKENLARALIANKANGDLATIHNERWEVEQGICELLDKTGTVGTGIALASTRDIEKEFAKGIKNGTGSEISVRMSSMQEVAEAASNAAAMLLVEKPQTDKAELIRALESLGNDLDSNDALASYFRDHAKVALMQKIKNGRVYNVAELRGGMALAAGLLKKEPKYFAALHVDAEENRRKISRKAPSVREKTDNPDANTEGTQKMNAVRLSNGKIRLDFGNELDSIADECPCPTCMFRSTPRYKSILEQYSQNHSLPAENCQLSDYISYISDLAYFANYVYMENGTSMAEQNQKYSLATFDFRMLLRFEDDDYYRLKEKAQEPDAKCIKELGKLAHAYPRDETVLDLYAEVLIHDFQFHAAEKVLDKIDVLHPDKRAHDCINARAQLMIQRDFDFERALRIADEGLLLYPKSFDLNITKAAVLSWSNDKNGAATYREAARAIDSKRYEKFMKEHWIEDAPEEMKTLRFMHTCNEIMMLHDGNAEAQKLLERAVRFCPRGNRDAEMLVRRMGFDIALSQNDLARAAALVAEMQLAGVEENCLYCEGALAYRQGGWKTALSKAREAQEMASKKKAKYFLPALYLIEEVSRAQGDAEGLKDAREKIAAARAYLATIAPPKFGRQR